MLVSLDTKLREITVDPLVFVCAEQECYRRRAAVFVVTCWVGSQLDIFRDGVRAGWSAGWPVDDVACLCPALRPLLFGVYKHKQRIPR